MKYFGIIFCTFCLLSFWGLNAYSDRLYTWEDNEGVVHITEDPPPKNAKNTDIVDYTKPPEQPRDQKQTNQRRKKNTNQGVSEGRDKAIEATDTFEDEWDYDYYYDDDDDSDAYFWHKKRKEEREEEMREKIKEKNADSIEEKKRESRNRNSRSRSPSGGRH